ncbi:hypothetical protein [Pseudactinotalea sp.]|uniref:hypothetical protein n=1 Tax=Pseudactinotalea sp. TaxID=1926260 RepID=UPI003B3A8595
MTTVAHDTQQARPRSLLATIWPGALGALVAVGTVYGLVDGRDVASVVIASGLVYLAAAAFRRRGAAWPAFGVTFVLIALAKLVELDAALWMLVGAAVLVVVGAAAGGWQPRWRLPLQTVAMLALAAIALLAVRVDAMAGGLLVSAALLAHAGWDVYHHRTGRVVTRSLAEFCCVLDVVLALLVAIVTLTA